MTFESWCAAHGDYLNDSDDAAKAARLMARRAWDAADRERSELRADAERYRWLRDPKNAYHEAWNYFSPYGSAAEMDAVIDAAILGARETPRAAEVLQKPLD